MFRRHPRLKYIFALTWLAVTLALAVWWIYTLNSIIASLESGVQDWSKHIPTLKNMVFWEGISLIFLILVGAIPLIYLIYTVDVNTQKIKQFFATFSHDLKTSMASLRLQAEVIQEGLEKSPLDSAEGRSMREVVDRLLGDTERLHLQLENSLYLANEDNQQMFIQDVDVKSVVLGLRQNWPQLSISFEGDDIKVKADRRALEGVLNNLCHNSLIHGEASQLTVTATDLDDQLALIKVWDNGKGFAGDLHSLAHPYVRHNPSSGSGMGLFISKSLIQSMHGRFNLPQGESLSQNGFAVEIVLPRGMQ